MTTINRDLQPSEPGAACVEDAPVERDTYRWIVLAILSVVSAFSLMDRQLPFVMAEHIKRDLGLSDGQLGLIGGLAFSAFYTIFSLPAARLADRTSSKWVIVASLGIWSTMTALSAGAMNMVQLFFARIGLGIGEAGNLAPSHSLIARYFPPRLRATALSLMLVGATLGVTAGFALGGWLADTIGWRQTFAILGLAGMALAVLAAVALKDKRAPAAPGPSPSTFGVAKRLWRLRTFRYTALAASLHGVATTSILAWLAAFLIRTHDLSAAEAGSVVGVLTGVLGSLCTLIAGGLADFLSRRDVRWSLWIPCGGTLIGVPSYVVALLSPEIGLCLAALCIATLTSMSFAGPVFATVQNLATDQERATASATVVLIVTLIGGTAGPPLVGFLSDAITPYFGVKALGIALVLVAVISLALASVLFWRASHSAIGDLGAQKRGKNGC